MDSHGQQLEMVVNNIYIIGHSNDQVATGLNQIWQFY